MTKRKQPDDEDPIVEEGGSQRRKQKGKEEQLDTETRDDPPVLSLNIVRSKDERINTINNLMRSLDAALKVDDLVDVVTSIDSSTLELLSRKLEKICQNVTNTKYLERIEGAAPDDSKGQARSLAPFSLSPWSSAAIPAKLPVLPEIVDRTLLTATFTHSGCGIGRITDLNYERLEWVGDAYLYLTSTLLISQTFPNLLPGKCSQLRERLIKNTNLANYAQQYGFQTRAVLPKEVLHPQTSEPPAKVLGDIFEAYVAGVVLSDPINGLEHGSQWLKSLWSMTLAQDIRAEEKKGLNIGNSLWKLGDNSLPSESTGPDSGGVVQTSTAPALPLNAKEQVQKVLGAKGITIMYKDIGPPKRSEKDKLTYFSVGLYLTGWGERDKQLGYGTATSKKEAGMKAAEMALAHKKMIQGYAAKKAIFDVHLQREREAQERLGQ